MNEITIAALDPSLQKQVESARTAFDRGKPNFTAEMCAKILEQQPGCLSVRKLERAALLKIASVRRSGFSKMVMAISTAPFLLGGSMRLKSEPLLALTTSERLLRRDPNSVAALGLLGQAAMTLGWLETAIFACEAASDLEPDRPDLWVALSAAYLSGGRAHDAAHAAAEALRLHPAHADALTLQQSAAVAVMMAQGNRAQGGNSRGELNDEHRAAQVAEVARVAQQSVPPKA